MIQEAKERLVEAKDEMRGAAHRAEDGARRGWIHTAEQVAKVVGLARNIGLIDPSRWVEPRRRTSPLVFLGGVVVGFGAALLLAPASGNATIRRIAQLAGLDDRTPATGKITDAAREVLQTTDAAPGAGLHEGRPA